MVFTSPEWVLELPFDPPDSIPISDFMLDEKHGRYPLAQSKPPFTCGISGAEYTALQVRDRVDFLARALAKQFGWHPNQGTEWDKVIGVFSVNTVSPMDRSRAFLLQANVHAPPPIRLTRSPSPGQRTVWLAFQLLQMQHIQRLSSNTSSRRPRQRSCSLVFPYSQPRSKRHRMRESPGNACACLTCHRHFSVEISRRRNSRPSTSSSRKVLSCRNWRNCSGRKGKERNELLFCVTPAARQAYP
jgi:hypothetical protein